ncbi:YbjN domain-containing protein [Pararhodobacter sp.]|uniref:YbjN domain-containing protein n=1 Tax=Pararhodobacter sp. TaxID=2127056 RepID=UPI002AFE7C00|nr:YbjN domain-containing protein [Pararhodobacter sp.]
MLNFRTLATASALGTFLAFPAVSQVALGGMITGSDFDRVMEIAGSYGPVERRTDEVGDWIRGEMGGTVYTITFLNCDDNDQNCTSLQFRAWWNSNGNYTADHMNQWNRDRRFSDAYLDSRNNPTIEFDVNLAGGVTAVNFDDTVQWWQAVLRQFQDMVIDPVSRGQPPVTSSTPVPEMPPVQTPPSK